MSSITLRDYQVKACDAAEQAWRDGLRRLLIVCATGLGKTLLFSSLIRRDAERGGRRALVLAHRDELLEQAAEKIRLVHPAASIGFIRRGENQVDRSVVVASVQTIAGEHRLETLPRDFSLVVVDEAHHAVAPYHRKVLEHVGALDPARGPLLLGVTATPQRADKIGLSEVFQKIVFKMSILEGIIRGYLSDVRVASMRVRVDLGRVKTGVNGDYSKGSLGSALMAANAPRDIVAAYKREAAGRKTLCFTPTVEVARAVSAEFRKAGIPAEYIAGTMSMRERRNIRKRFASGETLVVSNASVWTEGFDEPSVSCVIIARGTKSVGLYIQMVGRGTRPSPATGKRDCVVLDLVSDDQKLVTLSTITGLPSKLLNEMSVLEVLRAGRPLIEEGAEGIDADERGKLERAVASNPFTEFSWVRLDGQYHRIYALSLGGGGFLYVIPGATRQYDVMRYDRTLPECADGMMEVIAESLPIDYAMGCAEDVVRDCEAMRLAVASAVWRRTRASEKQLVELRKNRLPAPPAMTKGQAADLLSAHFARETLERLTRASAR